MKQYEPCIQNNNNNNNNKFLFKKRIKTEEKKRKELSGEREREGVQGDFIFYFSFLHFFLRSTEIEQ